MNILISVTLAMILFVAIRRTEKELALLKILSIPNARAKTRISLAIDRPGKDAGTDFINVSLWAPLAENVCEYLSKGRQIAVEGRLQTGSYTDQSGKNVYTISVNNA